MSARAGRVCSPGCGAAGRTPACTRPAASSVGTPQRDFSWSEVMMQREQSGVPRLLFLALTRQFEAQRPVPRQRVALPQAGRPSGIGFAGEETLSAYVGLGSPARAEVGQRAEAGARAQRKAAVEALVGLKGGFDEGVDHRTALKRIGHGPGETGTAVDFGHEWLGAVREPPPCPAGVYLPGQRLKELVSRRDRNDVHGFQVLEPRPDSVAVIAHCNIEKLYLSPLGVAAFWIQQIVVRGAGAQLDKVHPIAAAAAEREAGCSVALIRTGFRHGNRRIVCP